ncbi:MAG TPA: prephenate dehydratase domain-containing protein [Allosphingosinicella sp.]
MKIAYSGAPGAFAHEACLAFAPDLSPMAVDGFAAVADAVESGAAGFGMLPLHNSAAGTVEDVAELLRTRPLHIVAEHDLSVRMHLLGLPETDISAVRIVRSHPMALRQCARALDALSVELVEAGNTAVAARNLADPAHAVLASEAAAKAYGLIILQRDLQEDPDNRTRFALVVAGQYDGGVSTSRFPSA